MAFSPATSDTLPFVSFDMVFEYMKASPSFTSAEFKGAKAARSARAEYGDKAIGFVELKRTGTECLVRGKITPEHKLRAHPYTVSASINEADDSVIAAECDDCASSQGGCKHAIAFLFWLHRRSEEPSPTEVESYWRKSSLAKVGSTKVCPLKKLCKKGTYVQIPEASVDLTGIARDVFLREKCDNMLLLNQPNNRLEDYMSLNNLNLSFSHTDVEKGPEQFLEYCSQQMTVDFCKQIQNLTCDQSESSLWFEMRYGRVTASTLHACCRCRTAGGSLVETILGAGQPIATAAMTRGKRLEPDVVLAVERKLGVSFKKCGLLLHPDYPYLGASPDAIGDSYCVEIKCPTKEMERYISADGIVGPQFEAQLLLQMKFYNVKKGLFVVADPAFEDNNRINIKWIDLDDHKLSQMLRDSKSFWSQMIYPHL